MPYAIEVEKELGKQLSLDTSFQGNAQAFGASLSSPPILIGRSRSSRIERLVHVMFF
jgi:hypothetical protein